MLIHQSPAPTVLVAQELLNIILNSLPRSVHAPENDGAGFREEGLFELMTGPPFHAPFATKRLPVSMQ